MSLSSRREETERCRGSDGGRGGGGGGVIGCKGGACATNGAAPGLAGLVFGDQVKTKTKDC